MTPRARGYPPDAETVGGSVGAGAHPTLMTSTIMQIVSEYVHGYGTPEQQRLVRQAEHWRHRLIRDGTQLEPGTRLLEVGCGVGVVLAVLGQEFPGVYVTGV